ncbi:Putative F-box protein At1g53550 [Linum grandiflorum]
MAKRSSSSSPYLPEDLIIIDIQRRLPLSCLPRLCCVSKSWNSILSNPNFVYDSLFSDAPANTQLLITTADIERTTHVYSSLSYDSLLPSNNNNSDVVFRQLPDELLHGGRFTALKLASCGGGLICFDYFDENLMVCLFNPATSETKILPPILLPSHHQIWYPHNQIWYPHNFCIGLTVMETDQGGEEDDKYYRYKLVSVSQYHVHTFTATGLENLRLEKKVHVFSSDYESLGWRELLPLLDSSSSSIILPSNLVLVTEISQWKKKKCYWIATEDGARDDEFYIVSFDPNTDMFHVGETKLPFPDKTWVVDSPVYMVKEEALVVLNGANEDYRNMEK